MRYVMMAMPFTRPASVARPTVWRRFTVTTAAGPLACQVRDLMPGQEELAIGLMLQHFTADEPPCKHIGVRSHPGALRELQALWRATVKDGVSLVCVEEADQSKVVGVNLLNVQLRDDEEEFRTDDPIWAQLYGAVAFVSKQVDVFAQYGVDRYLNANGLIVAPEYRGLNIGKEILKARIPLCKALDIRLTATVFTAAASQVLAAKAGFETVYEITYKELADKGFVFPGIEASTKSSKFMALVIE